ncbi:hypothetical protein PR001_g3873 [Phytophthora rubi]|uniref:Sfi1 spindle body domain-containing protein n=1 Tax=Phytophthora rubi TaxID=129364 RepID=A0A6A3NUL5_9STRA|nr:hypothetical protein PR001_g3873 [Phytophthora rubi]
MTLEDTDDACVYVKESVLRELEQERRRLKWQLSRALQTSDVRAAELEASKAKVKDLLTIVEVNKGVADHVVQRSQGRETKRRAELETLHQQNKQQRQRYVDLALRSMSRRVRDRQQRDAFHSLQQAVLNRSRRREALLRLVARVRWRALKRCLERWKRSCYLEGYDGTVSWSTGSAKVHPMSNDQLGMRQVALTHSTEHSNTRLIGSDSRVFVRWQLLRKVWRNWERVVRWKRRHREFVRIASERSLRLVFVAWRSRARVLRQQRVLVRRVLARTSRRIQQLGLTSLRLRCAEVSAHEWSQVLKTAHLAMEEERKLRAEVQSSAASELHTAYIREQQRQQRFTELQTQRLEAFKRRECKHRALTILRCEMIWTRQKNEIALRFQRLQHHRRVVRRLFTSWKHVAGRSRRIKSVIAAWDARRVHFTQVNGFILFAWTLQRRRQRRFRLHALLSRLRRAWLLRGWVCLRIRSAIAERDAMAQVELWQFTQQAEAMQTASQEEIRRRRRVALKYQITCALLMADKKHDKLLRRVFCGWSKRTATNARQRRALRRVAARKRVKALQAALQMWGHFNDGKAVRRNQLHRYHLTRRLRALQVAFDSWNRNTRERLRLRLASYRQRSCFRAWRQSHHLRKKRMQWLGQFLQRSMHKWRRQAFQSWKQKHDHYVTLCVRREHAEHELVARLWRRWIGFVACTIITICDRPELDVLV